MWEIEEGIVAVDSGARSSMDRQDKRDTTHRIDRAIIDKKLASYYTQIKQMKSGGRH